MSSKKKGGASAGQNQQFSSKFGHPHGNANLRVPPPASNKIPTTQVHVNGGGLSKENGVNNGTKGKITSMKAPPSHYVVVQRHGQNIVDHRHQAKQSPK